MPLGVPGEHHKLPFSLYLAILIMVRRMALLLHTTFFLTAGSGSTSPESLPKTRRAGKFVINRISSGKSLKIEALSSRG